MVHGNSNPGTRLLIEGLQLLKEKSMLPKTFNFMIIPRFHEKVEDAKFWLWHSFARVLDVILSPMNS